MDAILLMTALFLQPTCSVTRITTQEPFQVTEYTCSHGTYRTMQKRCRDWWGLPFLLVNTQTNQGFYLNRFGGTQASAVGVMPEEVYTPLCNQ